MHNNQHLTKSHVELEVNSTVNNICQVWNSLMAITGLQFYSGPVYTTAEKSTSHEKRAFLNRDWSKMQLLTGGCLH